MTMKSKFLSGTVMPLALGISVVAAGGGYASAASSPGENPTAVPRPAQTGAIWLAAGCGACNPCNPCGANPCAAACNPCNPCGANPCAAACNPCNPCAANPCAAKSDCVVPRLHKAAHNPCNPCAANPCAAACNPCNPCWANPCAANPCAANPCAANPCAANPCAANPCAANPCAANPCAASNPCEPCGACNPCNPCAAGEAPELSAAEAIGAYNCIRGTLHAGYTKSGNAWAGQYAAWQNYSTQPYVSDTHGGRYVNNYANGRGSNYSQYENAGPAPVGTVLAKDSFSVSPTGQVGVGPLFLMEKMAAGFSSESGDWRYSLILPNGKVLGETGGVGGDKVGFCVDCHLAVEEQDSRFYLPDEYRVQ